MAQETGSPIIPFAITGDFKFRSKNLKLMFGNPIYVTKKEDLNSANERLKKEILMLINSDN